MKGMEGKEPASTPGRGAGRWIILLCAAACLITALIAHFAFERLPHLEDEVAYLFQARTLALGRLTVPSPESPEAFWTPFVLDHEGRRFGKYPPGWPAVLSLGVLAGAPWLVNPLLAALSVYLLYRLGRSLYDERAGLLAGVLALASPLFLVLSGSYLSHLASLAWLLLFGLWFLWAARGQSPWYALGAGLALGAAFLTRSLTAIAWAAPLGIWALWQVVRRQPGWPRYLLVALGAGVMTGTWKARLHVDPASPAIAEARFLVEDFVPERLDAASGTYLHIPRTEPRRRLWAVLAIFAIKLVAIVPHLVVLLFLNIARFVVFIVAQFAVLFTGSGQHSGLTEHEPADFTLASYAEAGAFWRWVDEIGLGDGGPSC